MVRELLDDPEVVAHQEEAVPSAVPSAQRLKMRKRLQFVRVHREAYDSDVRGCDHDGSIAE